MVLAHPTQTQIASRRVPVRRAVIWDSKLDSFSILSMAKRKGASELLGVMVKIGEIVEIDDGLTSNCFYLTLNGVKYLPYWDTARARKNEYACKNTDN